MCIPLQFRNIEITEPTKKFKRAGSHANFRSDESWSNTRQCQSVGPSQLNLNGFTHINFAFAFFDPSTFQITPMVAIPNSLSKEGY